MGLFGTAAKAGNSLFDRVNLAEDFYGRRSPLPPSGSGSGGSDSAAKMRFLLSAIEEDPTLTTAEARDFARANPTAYVQAHAAQLQSGETDYAAHYAMHGRGADGSLQQVRKQRSFAEKLLRGLGHGLQNYAAARGDPAAIYAVRERHARRVARRKEEAGFAEHDRLIQAMMRQGMSADEAELSLTNPDKFGEYFNSRLRTDDLAPDHERVTPQLGGGFATYRAGKTIEQGPDVVRVRGQSGYVPPPQLGGFGSPPPLGGFARDPNYQPGSTGRFSGPTIPVRVPDASNSNVELLYQGKSEAVRAATEAGYQPGTPEYLRFLRDYALKAYGPTGYQMHQQDNATSRYGADVGAATSRRGQDMTDSRGRWAAGLQSDTTRRGQDIQAATTRGSHAYRNGGGAGRSRRARARNAQGQEVQWNGLPEGEGGAWVPVK